MLDRNLNKMADISINSLAPGRCGSYFKSIIFNPIIQDINLDTCVKLL